MALKVIISVVVVFILTFAYGFVVHQLWLGETYQSLGIFRTPTEAETKFLWMAIGHLSLAIGLTWVYRRGHEAGKPWLQQGLVFAAAIMVMAAIPTYLIYHAVQPVPLDVALKQIMGEAAGMAVVGPVLALINR